MDSLELQKNKGEQQEGLTINMESRTAQQVVTAKNNYEKTLEELSKWSPDYDKMSFGASKELQEKSKQSYRDHVGALTNFAGEIGVEIKGYSQFSETEENIEPQAKKNHEEAIVKRQELEKLVPVLNQNAIAAKELSDKAAVKYNSSWFFQKWGGKLEQAATDAMYASSKANKELEQGKIDLAEAINAEARAKTAVEEAPALKQKMYDERIQNMSSEQWQLKIIAISKAIEAEISAKAQDAAKKIAVGNKEKERISKDLLDNLTKKKSSESELQTLESQIKEKRTLLADAKEKSDEYYTLTKEVSDLKINIAQKKNTIYEYAAMVEELHNADAINKASLDSLYQNESMLKLQLAQMKNDITSLSAQVEITVTLVKLSQTSEIASNSSQANKEVSLKALQNNLAMHQVAKQTLTKTIKSIGKQGLNIDENLEKAIEQFKLEDQNAVDAVEEYFNKKGTK